jgi:hypothetical protein
MSFFRELSVPLGAYWKTGMPVGEISSGVLGPGFPGIESRLTIVYHPSVATGECAGSRRVP